VHSPFSHSLLALRACFLPLYQFSRSSLSSHARDLLSHSVLAILSIFLFHTVLALLFLALSLTHTQFSRLPLTRALLSLTLITRASRLLTPPLVSVRSSPPPLALLIHSDLVLVISSLTQFSRSCPYFYFTQFSRSSFSLSLAHTHTQFSPPPL